MLDLPLIRDNATVFTHMVKASSVEFVEEFSPLPEEHTGVLFVVGAIEGRWTAPPRDIKEERARIERELSLLAEVIDAQLDVLDPPWQRRAANWLRKRKVPEKPGQTIVLAERMLRRTELLLELRELGEAGK